MKRIATFSFAVALMISFSLMPVGAANRIKRDQAAVSFPETVKLLGVLLRGDYVIVHDEEMMALGEACTYVYTSDYGQPGKLIISFQWRSAFRSPEHSTSRRCCSSCRPRCSLYPVNRSLSGCVLEREAGMHAKQNGSC